MRIIKQSGAWTAILGCSLALCACSGLPKGHAELDVGMKERGVASWYGDDFHGWMTASGDPYDMYALTGAHRTLPLGTVVDVTNVLNGKHVRIRINDRGPYVNGRILDLSYAAAGELGMLESGIGAVYLEVVGSQRMDLADSYFMPLGITAAKPWVPSDLTEEFAYRSRLGSVLARMNRHPLQIPGDLLYERRVRRSDGSAPADHRSDVVASLILS